MIKNKVVGGSLFQCNPRKFRVFDVVAMGGRINNWAAKQRRDEILVGDRAALWISAGEPGYSAGIYAIGSAPRAPGPASSIAYWVGPALEPDDFVDIHFDRCVFHFPVDKAILANDVDFRRAGILAMPRFTTSALSPAEWSAIEHKIVKHNPTASPALTRRVAGRRPDRW